MGVFDWLKRKNTQESNNVIKQHPRMPITKDWTDKYTVNSDLTRGLYFNTYPGLKLAGGLAYPPIAIPVNFMGLPIPKPVNNNDEELQKELNDLIEQKSKKITLINTFCHVDGTIWVWPFWSTKKNNLIWELIDDDSVPTIVRDVETKDIIKIVTDEELTITTGYNEEVNVKRRRTFTKSEIVIEWFGTESLIPGNLKSVRMRNVFNVIPIPFSNNVAPGDVRGHSDYERIITDLKDYHDIDLAGSTIIAKFQPKLVQETVNADEWIKNILNTNGWSSASEIDIANLDLILNITGEKTDILWPERAYEAYIETKKQKFHKLVQASGCPEIVWGLKTEGNNASVETSMDGLMKFTHGKQDQNTDNYNYLITVSIQIKRFVNMNSPAPEIITTWDDLDAVSDEVRSIIFKNFSEGVNKLISIAGITKTQIYKLYKQMYPSLTDETIEDFIIGLSDMAQFKQYQNASYTEALDFNNGDSDNGFDLSQDGDNGSI